MVVWHKVSGGLLIGYLCWSRSFAYLGIPPLKLFIGEIALAAFLLLKPRVVLGTWAASLFRRSPLNALGLALLVFVLYGVWQVGRGVLGDNSSVVFTLKYFVFNYYAIYLFFGIWVGLQAPDFLPKLVRIIAWVNGIYGILYISMLKFVPLTIPGIGAPLFGQPVGSAVAIVGLLCFERNLAAVWPLLALNIIVTLATQIRAEWLAVAVGMLVWGLCTGRLARVFAIGLAGLAVLGLIDLSGLELSGRVGGGLSLGNVLARVIAPIDVELAKEFSPYAEKHAGTVIWRELWWERIWISAHSTPMLEAFGHGYGFDLFSLAPPGVRQGQAADIRSPHSVFYFTLGYTGWVGVALFGLLQLAILRVLWQAYRVGGSVIGLAVWAMGLAMGMVGNYFETPYGAIPFYLLVGMGMAPALRPKGASDARPAPA